MSERGGRGDPEQSRETMKKLFLNKWGALLGVIVVTLGIKLGLDEVKTQQIKDEVESTLRLNEDDLPKDKEETKRGVEAIEILSRALQDAVARYEVAESPTVASEETGEEPRVVSSELVDSKPTRIVMKEILSNGTERYIFHDLTVPEEITATDENYKAIKDYFKSDCPGWTVEKENEWDYKVELRNEGSDQLSDQLRIRVEEDGSYTIGSLTGLEEERNVNSIGDIAKVLKDKEEILSLSEELREEKISFQEFKGKLKEMGYLPTGME